MPLHYRPYIHAISISNRHANITQQQQEDWHIVIPDNINNNSSAPSTATSLGNFPSRVVSPAPGIGDEPLYTTSTAINNISALTSLKEKCLCKKYFNSVDACYNASLLHCCSLAAALKILMKHWPSFFCSTSPTECQVIPCCWPVVWAHCRVLYRHVCPWHRTITVTILRRTHPHHAFGNGAHAGLLAWCQSLVGQGFAKVCDYVVFDSNFECDSCSTICSIYY